MKTKFVGFRISDDVYRKIFKLKHEKTITQFFCELIDHEFDKMEKSTEDYIATLRHIEKIIQRIENSYEHNPQDQECIKRLEKIFSLLEMNLEISVIIAASSPASTNLIRRKYPTLIQDALEKR